MCRCLRVFGVVTRLLTRLSNNVLPRVFGKKKYGVGVMSKIVQLYFSTTTTKNTPEKQKNKRESLEGEVEADNDYVTYDRKKKKKKR